MAEYRYDQPAVERPRCWGKSYDETSRECKGCGFQNSCKEEIIRLNVNRQPVAPPYVSSPYGGVPYAGYSRPVVPQPVQPVQVNQYPQRTMNYVPQQMQPVQQVMQQQPGMTRPAMVPRVMTGEQHGYGWVNDPMFYHIHTTPPPMRVQMPGETFLERAGKNAVLGIIEAVLGAVLLAIRQWVWPPPQPVPQFANRTA